MHAGTSIEGRPAPVIKERKLCQNIAKYGELGNIGCYEGKGKHGVLGGIHWWFGPGCIARIKANYLIWYPAYPRSVVYLRMVIYGNLAWVTTDEIQWVSKVTTYVHCLSCGTGG